MTHNKASPAVVQALQKALVQRTYDELCRVWNVPEKDFQSVRLSISRAINQRPISPQQENRLCEYLGLDCRKPVPVTIFLNPGEKLQVVKSPKLKRKKRVRWRIDLPPELQKPCKELGLNPRKIIMDAVSSRSASLYTPGE